MKDVTIRVNHNDSDEKIKRMFKHARDIFGGAYNVVIVIEPEPELKTVSQPGQARPEQRDTTEKAEYEQYRPRAYDEAAARFYAENSKCKD